MRSRISLDNPTLSVGRSRRDFIQAGTLGALGLTLGDAFTRQAAAAGVTTGKGTPPALSCIHIYLPGGMAHQESFDPKPFAPAEYRGPLGSIDTKIPGVKFGELWGKTAQIADKLAVCRSMTHGEAAHERGTHNMFTGYRPSPALTYPAMGSVVSHELGPQKNLPPYVAIPNLPTNFAGSGYLSSAYGPFALGGDPGNGNFSVQDLQLPGGVDDARFGQRKNMLAAVDAHFAKVEKADNVQAMNTFYQRAYDLISSPAAKAAFDLNKEPGKLRDEYGRSTAGGRLIMARRLVEAGVRFVTVNYGGWDHHVDINGSMRGQVPQFDQAFARLISDLDERGLLKTTLVMVSSEFGRTPKINAQAGRDHWPKVFSVLLAGGGIKRGVAYGTSDATATEPEDNPLTLEELSATVFWQLGIHYDAQLMSPGGRPQYVVKDGKVVKELVG